VGKVENDLKRTGNDGIRMNCDKKDIASEMTALAEFIVSFRTASTKVHRCAVLLLANPNYLGLAIVSNY
jgi:hypothetical protein